MCKTFIDFNEYLVYFPVKETSMARLDKSRYLIYTHAEGSLTRDYFDPLITPKNVYESSTSFGKSLAQSLQNIEICIFLLEPVSGLLEYHDTSVLLLMILET